MKKYLILLFSFLLLACGKAKNSDIPIVNLILDTDMGPDYDDVGAMTLMYALADSGQVNILATLSSNKDEQAIPCIEVINEYFKRSNIPVGAPKNIAPSLTTWHKESKWTDYLDSQNIGCAGCSPSLPTNTQPATRHKRYYLYHRIFQ